MTLLVAGAALMGLGVLAGVTSWRRRTAEYADWWEDE
jgi:MYXO-CTERM domain-containing protein